MSEAIKEKNIVEPSEIFDYVRTRLIESISKDNQQDGMDGILICFDITLKNSGIRNLSYAAANNAPILCRKNKDTFDLIELPKDKMPVGKGEKLQNFKPYSVELNKDDTLFLFTDGYADQFGGTKGKKFKYKPLNELLVNSCALEFNEQKQKLATTFNNWKGNLEQVDDVCIIGLKL